jgi:methionyl-tRNA formyltransferase
MITFLGSGTLGTKLLNHLLKKYNDFKINVITKVDKLANRGYKPKPTPIKEYLIKNDLINKVNLVEVDTLKKLNENEKNIIKEMLMNSEIGIVCDIGLIVPEDFINLPKIFINIHPSLLPFYRGPSPIEFALLNNETITGITICLLSKKVDAGEIIIQKIIKIDPTDNSFSLKSKIIELIPEIFDSFFYMYKKNSINFIKQDEIIATYTKKINDNDFEIDLNEDIEKIHNKIRAFYPNAYLNHNSQRIKIYDSNLIASKSINNVKSIKYNPKFPFFKVLNNRLFLVNLKNEFLEILKLQLPNKKPIKSIEFINGYYRN